MGAGFRVAKWIVGLVLLLALAAGGYTWVTLHWAYSTGERAGYVQKLSNRGWICKTWEGELQMLPVPGAVPEKFFFTVRDASVVEDLQKTIGKRVVLVYEQHKGVPTSCFGDTEYFITDVRVIE